MKKSQHIIRVKAKNIKNVRIVDFQPNRYITKVSGGNGAGKTSALDAVFFALLPQRTLDPKLIRQGERTGEIFLETETHALTRRLDDRGGSLLIEVKESKTLVKDPVDWLKTIGSNLGFDPLEFMRMDGDEQRDVLKAIAPLEVDIDDLQSKNEDDDQIITDKKKEMKTLVSARDSNPFDDKLPREVIDVNDLLKEARAIDDHNREIGSERIRRGQYGDEGVRLMEEIERDKRRVLELKAEMDRIDAALIPKFERAEAMGAEMKKWNPLPDLKDRRAIDDQIGNASSTNSKITLNNAAREQFERRDGEIRELDSEINNLKALVANRKQTIAKALENAQFPIPGLGYAWEEQGAGGRRLTHPKRIVTYHGLPLKDASTGEQIRVSAAIGMAGKPELRFLLIREGSLLDDKGMEILERMAHENDWQILCEVVDTSGKVGIYLEDGEIVAVNKEPEPKTEPATPRRGKKRTPKTGKLNYGDE